MMKPTLEEVKDYLRLDEGFEDEDTLIQTLIDASESYVLTALGRDILPEVDTSKIIILILTAHWYENRGLQSNSKSLNSAIDFTVRALLDQLMWSNLEDDEEC